MTSPKRGFTLVDLLATLAVLGLLFGLLVPAVLRSAEAARRQQCTNNLKQTSLAAHNYNDSWKALPNDGYFIVGKTNKQQWCGFFPKLLPNLELLKAYDSFDFDKNYDDAKTNAEGAKYCVSDFLCPSCSQKKSLVAGEGEWYTTHYYGVGGSTGYKPNSTTEKYGLITPKQTLGAIADNGLLTVGYHRTRDFATDGLSNTALFFESSWDDFEGYRGWQRGTYVVEPGEDYQTPGNGYWETHSVKFFDKEFGVNAGIKAKRRGDRSGAERFSRFRDTALCTSEHSGGANIAMADGSVRFLSEDVADNIYLSIGSANGEEKYKLE